MEEMKMRGGKWKKKEESEVVSTEGWDKMKKFGLDGIANQNRRKIWGRIYPSIALSPYCPSP
jgi:hypothetical protein